MTKGMGLGACAAGDPHSALAGRSALLEGGNAVDAAVAAGLMGCFTMPTMTGLGGAGLMTIRMRDEIRVLDFFANIPGLGRPGPRPDPEVVQVPFEDVVETFLVGAPSIAVPGVVAGLWEVHGRYGRLPMKELVGLVVEAARGGAEMQDAQYRGFALLHTIFRRTPEAWVLCGDENGIYPIGHAMRNVALADTLERLASEGPPAFYAGEIADAIVEAAEGLVTHADLESYRTAWREPLAGSYRDWDLWLPGIPSLSGGMLLAAFAALDAGERLPGLLAPKDWWRLADAMRRSEAVRTSEYESSLFTEGYLQTLVASCRSGNTMHISTIDTEGNAVSYTSTMGECAGLAAKGYGFALNNFMGEPDILPRGEVVAGARMMTSMCPTIARDPEGGWLAIGSAGSSRIRSAILQVLVRAIDGGVPLIEAVSRPRIHVQQEKLYVEGYGRTPEQVESLRPYGLEMVTTWAPGFFFGGAQAVRRTADGMFEVAADHVRRGCAGYLA